MLLIEARPRPASARQSLGGALGNAGPPSAPAVPVAPSAPSAPPLGDLPCVQRKPSGAPFGTWMIDTLVRCRGVVAALPRSVWPANDKEADAPVGRIVALDASRACGRAWWWLWRLKESEYIGKSAYALDEWSFVYHTDGLEAEANGWLPDSGCYDAQVLGSEFDLISLAGFAATVRYVPPPLGDSPGTMNALPALQQRVLLELEAGATGTGPAVLATALVHEHEKYTDYEARTSPADDKLPEAAAVSAAPGRVVACVSVTQVHSFRLTDLLGGYNAVLGDPLLRPTLPSANGSLFELTAALARKVRALAKSRIVKLNITPETVVFVPQLVRNDATGLIEAQGYGYEGMEAVRGVPFMWDFDPLYTKRVTSATPSYDENCAYVTMMLVLLATVRAQFGEAASRIMIHKVVGRSVEGKSLASDELPESFADIDLVAAGRASRDKAFGFCGVLRAVLPVFAKEQESSLGVAYAEIACDFADIIRSNMLERWAGDVPSVFDSERAVFPLLVCYLSNSTHADSALFSASPEDAQAEALLDRERARRVERRLEAVRANRRDRLLAQSSRD